VLIAPNKSIIWKLVKVHHSTGSLLDTKSRMWVEYIDTRKIRWLFLS